MQAKKEREMLKEQKSRDIQEKKFVKKKVLPPTQDELLLFGDVIKQVNMQSEIDEQVNPLETGKQKFEA